VWELIKVIVFSNKKDIIEYQNKWEILGTFVENGELSTEKK
jgi:hypothetical protein